MQKALLLKFLMIGGLVILLLIPISMIHGVIKERIYYRANVIKDIAKSSTGPQQITGVLIVAPYREKVTRQVEIYDDGKRQTVQKEHFVDRYKYFLPEELNISGSITTKELYRGIYKVPVYTAGLVMKGNFEIPANLGLEKTNNITWQKPYMVLGIKDIRGINRSAHLKINDLNSEIMPGTKVDFIQQGIHSNLEIDFAKENKLAFNLDLELQGMQELFFLPMGKFTKVDISSPWPHPSFNGRFLPKTRDVSAQGFTASWETSFFASNMEKHLRKCTQSKQCHSFNKNSFGVSLHEGVDIYLQAKRSVKYALLFIGLTFVAFFLFEILKGTAIHAIQYSLVGVALALFYLLLVSLSEHIRFGLSYLIASASCTSLLGFYVSAVFKSKARGLIFGLSLSGLYGTLYILIRSEDTALLMGSGLIFGVVALIMALTRNVDWYKIGANTKQQLAANKKSEAKKVQSSNPEITP